jgi:hypothetical protein
MSLWIYGGITAIPPDTSKPTAGAKKKKKKRKEKETFPTSKHIT